MIDFAQNFFETSIYRSNTKRLNYYDNIMDRNSPSLLDIAESVYQNTVEETFEDRTSSFTLLDSSFVYKIQLNHQLIGRLQGKIKKKVPAIRLFFSNT